MFIIMCILVIASTMLAIIGIMSIISKNWSKSRFTFYLMMDALALGVPTTIYALWSNNYGLLQCAIKAYWILYFAVSDFLLIISKRKWNKIRVDDLNGMFIMGMILLSRLSFQELDMLFTYGALSYAATAGIIMLIRPLKK